MLKTQYIYLSNIAWDTKTLFMFILIYPPPLVLFSNVLIFKTTEKSASSVSYDMLCSVVKYIYAVLRIFRCFNHKTGKKRHKFN